MTAIEGTVTGGEFTKETSDIVRQLSGIEGEVYFVTVAMSGSGVPEALRTMGSRVEITHSLKGEHT